MRSDIMERPLTAGEPVLGSVGLLAALPGTPGRRGDPTPATGVTGRLAARAKAS